MGTASVRGLAFLHRSVAWVRGIPERYFSLGFFAPETEKYWTILYYGVRGSGKTLHQARTVLKVFRYLDVLYARRPLLHSAIVYSVQKFSPAVERRYLGSRLFYWSDASDLQFCPRSVCWRGEGKHRLHGAYLIFDDMATILPADSWQSHPIWMRKMFAQARHFGIRVLANCQDPFSVDINFRRYVDVAFRFRKLFGSKDPDETKPGVRWIYGMYQRRRISADLLWNQGDKSEDEIQLQKLMHDRINEVNETNLFYDTWRASLHFITRSVCGAYDTTQDVPEYKPKGFKHEEYRCIDPAHPDCGYHKALHELI